MYKCIYNNLKHTSFVTVTLTEQFWFNLTQFKIYILKKKTYVFFEKLSLHVFTIFASTKNSEDIYSQCLLF